ncbi:hypothetical protein CSB96_1235 [Pseudomonas aeruginosa]|nr:hypothetical protein CSB96_1235 [Pseudomonas aeruginosa]
MTLQVRNVGGVDSAAARLSCLHFVAAGPRPAIGTIEDSPHG